MINQVSASLRRLEPFDWKVLRLAVQQSKDDLLGAGTAGLAVALEVPEQVVVDSALRLAEAGFMTLVPADEVEVGVGL